MEQKKLVMFNIGQGPGTEDLSIDSNSWYLKAYETYFDKVQHLSLSGKRRPEVAEGNTSYHFRGSGPGLIDILLSPFRLYRFIKKEKPTAVISYEQLWFWWSVKWVKWFTRVPVYLLPITYPEQMYKVTGKGLSGKLPIWMERILLRKSYRSADKVVTSYNVGNYTNWMLENKIIQPKLVISDVLPESVVFPAFMRRLNYLNQHPGEVEKNNKTIDLIYVGRLHVEKMADHLIKALPAIRAAVPQVALKIIGTGSDREMLENMAREYGVDDITEFAGYVPHGKLPDHLLRADVFVSPSTGHAFREAAICGLPIVAYNIDWLKGFLVHRENFYGIDDIDYSKFATGVIDVLKDPLLKSKLSANIKTMADQYWSPKNVLPSLQKIFN